MERQKHSSLILAVIVAALAVASVVFWRTEVATDRATGINVWLNSDLFYQYYPMKELNAGICVGLFSGREDRSG